MKRKSRKVRKSSAGGYRINDALWSKIEPLLPEHVNTHRFGGGRPRVPDRRCMDGIFFVLRTGCQWKALDATDICSGSTAHSRFQEWVQAGVFLKFWEAELLEYDELKGLNWQWLALDGAMTKAPLGGGKKRAQSHRQRQTRHQEEPVDRSHRHSSGVGGRRSQPPRHEVSALDTGEHS